MRWKSGDVARVKAGGEVVMSVGAEDGGGGKERGGGEGSDVV